LKISIVIPCFNEETLLPGLLAQLNDKVLRGKFNYEIILSDGGSTDNTLRVAEGLADIICLHDGKKRQNIAMGRNAGAEKASGDLILFLNGDVRIKSPEYFFSRILSAFSKKKYLGMTCNIEVFPEETVLSDKLFLMLYNNYFFLLNKLKIGMGRGECQIIPAKVFKEFSGYNEKLNAGEDFDLFRRIRQKGEIKFDRELVVYESPRRYRKYGHLTILIKWLFNAVYVLFTNKSLSKEWEPVR